MNNINKKYLYMGVAALAVVISVWSSSYRSNISTVSIDKVSASQSISSNIAIASPILVGSSTDMTLGQYSERPNATVPIKSILTPLVSGCSLRFSFSPKSKVVSIGGNVTYDAMVSNAGDMSCKNVSLSVYYSDNESFVSSNPRPTSSNYYWNIGNMASRKSYLVTVITKQLSVTEPYQISNQACATADNSSDVCPENIVFISGNKSVAASSELPIFTNEYGVWVWQSPIEMSPGYAPLMVRALAANHFNTVYITVDDYLNIVSLPEGSDKDSQKTNYMKALSNIITLANTDGIAVDVEGGAKDWDSQTNRWKGFALIDFVSEYNKSHPSSKIHALQYDVEPYLLSAYQTDQVGVLTDFVSFIDESAKRMQNVDAGFSVVIPHFYDSEQKWTPPITYNGKTEYTFTQLLDVLKVKPDSQLIVMAYRNYFSGSDGIQGLVSPEISEASNGGYKTKVIVAQETGNVDPSYVTYHSKTRSDLFDSISNIQQAFGRESAFGGVAVHYLDPYLQLQ